MRTKKAREKTKEGLAGFLQKKRWAWLSPGTKSIRAWKTKESRGVLRCKATSTAAASEASTGWLKLKEEHRDVEDFMEAIFLLASCLEACIPPASSL